MTLPATLMPSAPPLRLRTPPGLLLDARHVVLPDGITASGAPAIIETCQKLGIHLDRWQRDACAAILAKNATGWYAADMALLSIGRQVGKTFLVGAICFADSIANPGTLTVWTAHRFKVARESFDELRALAESEAMAPHVHKEAITTAAGNEVIPFRNGSRIVFAARERGSIRGFRKVRRLVLDEAQILTDAALSDLAPTQNQATNPQIILMGTPPKPSDPSEAFTRLRSEALSGEAEGVTYIEYGAAPGSDLDDRKAWATANPSYPDRTPERAIMRLRRLLDDDDFMREVMGIWTAEHGTKSPIEAARWFELADPDGARGGNPTFGVDIDEHRVGQITVLTQTAAGMRAEVAADPVPAHLLTARLGELVGRWGGQVAVPTVLLDEMSREGLPAVEVKASVWPQACAELLDALSAGSLRHGNQSALNEAMAALRWGPTATSGQRSFRLRDCPGAGPAFALIRALHGAGIDQPADFYMI